MVALAMGAASSSGYDEYWRKLLQGVRNNNPEVLSYFGSTIDIELSVKGLIRPMKRVKIDQKLFKDWMNPWGAKQCYALWYQHTGRILSSEMIVSVKWVTNDQILQGFDVAGLVENAENSATLSQGRLDASEQFAYRYSYNTEERIGMFVIGAHDASLCALFCYPKTSQQLLTTRSKFDGLFHTAPEAGITQL